MKMMTDNDISWFPINKALYLETEDKDELADLNWKEEGSSN
jgi:hypothetical protein